jgi:hypothetical protein
MFEKGVAVAIVSITRNSPRAIDPAVKSGNYLNNVLALGEARRTSGAYEAILCADDGTVAEGASSNVFAVVVARSGRRRRTSASWTASRARRSCNWRAPPASPSSSAASSPTSCVAPTRLS